ncbi:MAG: hypothetical protein JW995_00015 [Melioribacteraceae bacterium]|nr:hypothetical protein [Melioribacteraceae bacterium]
MKKTGNMIPDLYIKQKNKKTELIAVSLDEDILEWKKYSESISAGWLNVCDGQGHSARKYFIHATSQCFFWRKIGKSLTNR